MSDTVIKVENLGKKYSIRHEQRERCTVLRDVIADGAKRMARMILSPTTKNHEPRTKHQEPRTKNEERRTVTNALRYRNQDSDGKMPRRDPPAALGTFRCGEQPRAGTASGDGERQAE